MIDISHKIAKFSSKKKQKSYLCDPSGTFEIESLSMSLEVPFFVISRIFKASLVQLTGTKTAHARSAIGTKILSLKHESREGKKQIKTRKHRTQHF